MTAIAFHQFGFSLKSASNCPIVLLAQINYMRSLTRVLERFFVLRPIFLARLSVWRGQGTKLRFKKIAAASKIISTMQAGTSIDTPDADGKADNPGTDIADADIDADADREADPGIDTTDTDIDGQVAASDKAHASLFSLRKALFFCSLLLNRRPSPPLRHVQSFPCLQ